ncbi:hypothetical protein LTR37_020930 [Vermiconidia calcicola]|uniref:Uncharacterized protein n=1 Tax=Vermiconidia calcicola TaxID=1690605 RepID=A0ACC3MCY1_9PEZI|nr:hypothetical protein LTR37_020930 [Vermiconidia calcicola]
MHLDQATLSMLPKSLTLLRGFISYCNDHNVKFLAQSGGNGWADTLDLGEDGVIVNLRGLNSIVFNDVNEQVTLGGGTINGELTDASLANGKQARGNFGAVISVTMNTFPLINNGVIWAGELIFSGEKLERLVDTLNDLHLTAEMSLLLGFSFREDGPVITAQASYTSSNPEDGRTAFRALYNLDPDQDTTELLDYDHINEDTEFLCEDGGRKPGCSTGLRTFDYPTSQVIWDEFVTSVNGTGLDGTTILIECYSNDVLRDIGSEHASYANREIEYYAWILFGYAEKESDALAESFGSRVRALWRSASGSEQQRTYVHSLWRPFDVS